MTDNRTAKEVLDTAEGLLDHHPGAGLGELLWIFGRRERPDPVTVCGATTETSLLGSSYVYRCTREPGHGGRFHEGLSLAVVDGGICQWPVDARPWWAPWRRT